MTSTIPLRGLVAAAATPLLPDFSPDMPRLIGHCRQLLEGGCHGINLLGTTGEATSFSVEQRLQVMQAVADSGLPLQQFMVGTGAAALNDAVVLTRAACTLGFAGALLLPPFYYPGIGGEALVHYVELIVARVADPRLRLYLYHIPQNTQVPWPVDTVVEIRRRHGAQVVGLKDSAGDLAYARAVAAALPGFDVFPSAEGSIASAASDGFAGCISATLNLTAPATRRAWDLGPGTAEGAAALQVANQQRRLLSRLPLVASVKAALAGHYQEPAWARTCPPLWPLNDAERETLCADLLAASTGTAT